jgi:signal transduction histidine kinase
MHRNATPDSRPFAEYAFISEIFHELSQPLTALQCRLELALRRDETTEQLRETIETALENAERMRQRLLLIRALNDAAEPGNDSDTTDLSDLLKELHETFLPLFETDEKALVIALPTDPVLVQGSRGKLMRGLFCFLEYLIRYSTPKSVLEIKIAVRADKQAELRIASESCLPVGVSEDGEPEPNSLELKMAQRTFRAAGGDFRLIKWDSTRSFWLAQLPLA